MHRSVTAGIVALVCFLLYTIIKSKLKKRQNEAKAAALGCQPPPTLKSKNLLGNSVLRESMQATKEDRGPQFVVDTMNAISPDCHTLQVPILDYKIFVTRDPDNVKTLFTSPDFDISGTRQLSWMPLLGKGIFTSRGESWKHSRALLRPQFSKEMINQTGLEEKHLRALVAQFPADPATGWTDKFDLAPLLFRFTLDTATEFIFGQSTNSLGQQEGGDISRHFDAAKVWIDKRGALAKFYWLLNSREFQEHCSVIQKFADAIVADRLANPPEKEDGGKNPYSSATSSKRFYLLDELAKETQNPTELRNEMLHVLMAGRDTTGCLLGWVFYFLARHPEVYQRLRAEVLGRFGGGNNLPDHRSLNDMRYLQWVINETMRFVAVIPMNERFSMRDSTLPRGGGPDGKSRVFIPEGTQVLVPLYAMQHREDIWGPDVGQWRPERWADHRAGWEFIPFGAGIRKCLGQQFGRSEASFVIARFCQKYDAIENLEEGDGRLRLHHAIENRSGTGVQIRLHEAPAAE